MFIIPTYRFGRYIMTDSGRTLLRDDKLLPVSPKVLATLLTLVKSSGKVVSKEELMAAVWPDSFVEESNLTQNIWVLRKLLAPDFPDSSPIETVSRVGYRFTASVEIALADTVLPAFPVAGDDLASGQRQAVAPIVHPAAAMPGESVPSQKTDRAERAAALERGHRPWFALRRAGIVAGGLGLVILVAVLAAVLYGGRTRLRGEPRTAPTIAILSFQNLSGTADQAWLSAAFRETLFTDLSTGGDIRLTDVESAARAERELRLTSTDELSRGTLDRVCRDLGCDRVLSGSYLVANGKLRVDARLTDTDTGKVLATCSEVGKTDDLLPIIQKISTALRKTLGNTPVPFASEQAFDSTISVNPDAYRFYIQGLQASHAYDGRAAVDLERKSIAQDPQFALAHLALARALGVLGEERAAVEEARRATALDGPLPREQQLQIQAELAVAERQFAEAATFYQTLYTFFPKKPEYLMQTAANLAYAGDPGKAISLLRPLLAPAGLEGANPQLDSVLADCYGLMGDWAESRNWAAKGVEASVRRGSDVLTGRLMTSETQALLYLHQPEAALLRTQRALAIARQFGDYSGELRALNRLGQAQTALGHYAEAQSALEEALLIERERGEMQRQLHTLSALGQLRDKQGDRRGAAQAFQEELAVAKAFGQVDFLLGAELDFYRERWREQRNNDTRKALEGVAAKAESIGDRQIAAEARAEF